MIEKIKGEIGILGQVAARINELIDAVAGLRAMRGENGVTVNVTDTDVVIDGSGSGSGMPSGSTGDMLYHDGSDWVVLAAPTVSVANPVLRHDGTAPYWEEPEEC